MRSYKFCTKVPSKCPCCINVPKKDLKSIRNRNVRRRTRQALRRLT